MVGRHEKGGAGRMGMVRGGAGCGGAGPAVR